MKVAVLGLGAMGAPMARNLLRAGLEVAVYNRARDKAEALAADGARVAATPAEAASGAGLVLAMLSDDRASRQVWTGPDGALAALEPSAILVECSTISPAWARELGGLALARGIAMLDAPVTGSTDAAAAGTLGLFVGGDADVLERARPVLAAVSSVQTHLGPQGAGATMKLVNNLMIGVQALALAEGLALAERAGLPLEIVGQLVADGSPGSPLVRRKLPAMLARDTTPAFALRWLVKDLEYALDAAAALGGRLPATAAARDAYAAALDEGLGDRDFSAVAGMLRP